MGDNLRLIYDLMHYLDLHQLPGILLCLDFEKAFDSVDWEFMIKVLKAYGFGEEICGWIETFYKNIKSNVVVNGQSTQWFNIERGCRQGDPVSPYLFILVVEIMAIMIREDSNIKGVSINGIEHKISQFADDTQLFNNGDVMSFEKSIQVINKFGKVSGLFLNNTKTQAIWLGSKKHSKEKHMSNLNLDWNPKYFKILGVWFTTDLHEIEAKNYAEKMSEVQILFNIWSKRSITPLGRIAILKSLILSKLVYLWLLLPNPPDDSVSRLQLLCYKFVWSNKQDRISRKISIKNIRHGGMGIPDIRKYISALKLTWIRKLANTNHKWKNICTNLYPFLNNLNKYGSNIVNTMKENRFWIHVLDAYKQISCEIKPKKSSELLAEPILFNDNIMIGGACIKNMSWVNHGVYCIGHFYNINGNFLTFNEFKAKYNLRIDFVTYNGCKKSILRFFKKFDIQIKDNNYNDTTVTLQTLCSVGKGARLYYDILMLDEAKPKCCQNWNRKLESEIDWKTVFHKMHKIKDVKLKWFQLRIVHRIVATNIVLKSMGIVNNDKCNFCQEERDSIEHFLWKCRYSNSFWLSIEKIINERCQLAHNIRFNENIVIFNADVRFETDAVTDFITLLAKLYIFKCKVDRRLPCLNLFIKDLKYRYTIEEYNAKINCNTTQFDKDWFFHKSLFESISDSNNNNN